MHYSKQDWEKKIRNIARDSMRISFSRHALGQMRARKITQPMALDVLRKGRIFLSRNRISKPATHYAGWKDSLLAALLLSSSHARMSTPSTALSLLHL